jgi:hypothetical protein
MKNTKFTSNEIISLGNQLTSKSCHIKIPILTQLVRHCIIYAESPDSNSDHLTCSS